MINKEGFMEHKIDHLLEVISDISGAVEQRMGQIVNSDGFSIEAEEKPEDLAENIENLAVLDVSKNLDISNDIVVACHEYCKDHMKGSPKKIEIEVYHPVFRSDKK